MQMSGGSISHEEGARILTALGLKQVPESPECWLIPPHRLDLHASVRPAGGNRARLRPGRHTVPLLRPLRGGIPGGCGLQFPVELRRKLAALGFYETQTIKLIASESADGAIAQVKDALPLRPLQDGDLIRVSLPLSEDHSVLRPAHTPGLIAAAVRNSNQGVSGLRFLNLAASSAIRAAARAGTLKRIPWAFLFPGTARRAPGRTPSRSRPPLRTFWP